MKVIQESTEEYLNPSTWENYTLFHTSSSQDAKFLFWVVSLLLQDLAQLRLSVKTWELCRIKDRGKCLHELEGLLTFT